MSDPTSNYQLPCYFLKKPDLGKVDRGRIFAKLESLGNKFTEFLQVINEPRYLYWDEMRHKQMPEGLTPEETWFLVRQFRNAISRTTPIKAEKGDPFRWIRLPYVDEFLHKIDISSGGQIFTTMDVLSGSNKQKFISRGILEEAIASSQLEGAHTTRQAAKKMITEKREPRNKDEQMILNNYNTIVKIDEDYKSQPLSESLLFEMHRMLTQKTIEEEYQGRFRKDSDSIVVQGMIGNQEYISHIPPNESFVREEIKKVIEFANDADGEKFLHPIIKAIFLHFWIGYLHPFVDGNGRLARTLFYWYLLKKKYWTFMYLPISLVIKRAPIQYAMAYIYSEQDSRDATYFFDFHIRKIIQALNDFNEYVSEKILENKQIDSIISKDVNLVDRQRYLIHHLASETNAYSTITSHATLNNISRQTAAKDIKQLVNIGLIKGIKEGRYIKYRATQKLHDMPLHD